jgi:serine/threonine protein kinase
MIKNGEIYLIDFGLSTFYLDEDGEPIEDYSDSVGTMIGTLKYASLNIHEGHRYSRRDDLISLAYIYEYLKAGLIWMPTEKIFVDADIDAINVNRSDIQHPLNLDWKKSKIEHLEKTENRMLQLAYALKYNEIPDYFNIKKIFM